MLKTKTWVAIVAAAAVVFAVVSVFLLTSGNGSFTVEITQDGEIIKTIDLSKVAEEYSFTVQSKDGGMNVVTVQPYRIRVTEADCPDKICVERGWLSGGAAPIVCLPHGLVIRFAESEADAAAF